MKVSFFSVFLLFLHLQSFAADKVGNSGAGWLCKLNPPSNQIHDLLLVDLFEANEKYKNDLPSLTGISTPFENLEDLDLWFQNLLRRDISPYFDHVRRFHRLVSAELIPLPDTKPYMQPLPQNCPNGTWEFVQLAIFRPDGTIFIRQDLYESDHFSSQERLALLAHEAIYFFLRDQYGDEYSTRAREIVGILFLEVSDSVKVLNIRKILTQPPSMSEGNSHLVFDPLPLCRQIDYSSVPHELRQLVVDSTDNQIRTVELKENQSNKLSYHLREGRYATSAVKSVISIGSGDNGPVYPSVTLKARGSFVNLDIPELEQESFFSQLTFQNLDQLNFKNKKGVPVRKAYLFGERFFGVYNQIITPFNGGNSLFDSSELGGENLKIGSVHLVLIQSVSPIYSFEIQLYKLRIERSVDEKTITFRYARLAEIPVEDVQKFSCHAREKLFSKKDPSEISIYPEQFFSPYPSGSALNLVTATNSISDPFSGIHSQIFFRCSSITNSKCSASLPNVYPPNDNDWGTIIDLGNAPIDSFDQGSVDALIKNAEDKVRLPVRSQDLVIGRTYLIVNPVGIFGEARGVTYASLIQPTKIQADVIKLNWKRLRGQIYLVPNF